MIYYAELIVFYAEFLELTYAKVEIFLLKPNLG